MVKWFKSGFLLLVLLSILPTFSGCVPYDIVNIADTNNSYDNFSCKKDTEYGTITSFKHTCSFDIINKN